MEFVNCSSDLDVISIEWLYNRRVISQVTGNVLQLIFNPVSDTIHNRQYICRVTSPYGIQEKTIRIIATGSNDGCSVVSPPLSCTLQYHVHKSYHIHT